MRRQQSGFTLIELVIVIVILGLLAATALPRFADLTSDAARAARDGIAGGVRSASSIAHAQSLVNNDTTNSITLEGLAIAMANGYPTAASDGIGRAVNTGNISGSNPTSGSNQADFIWSIQTDCSVSYTAATGSTAPTISTSGSC